jgi:hypothetical protein
VDVAAWLNRLGLEQYERAFRENDVDAEVLPELTAEDLIGLGVTSIGHRRKLLAAIAALRDKPASPNENSAPIKAAGLAEDPSRWASSTAERRQLTVMFCDLVGRRRCPPASTPRICARSSAPTIAASPTPSAALAALSPSIWAMAC